VTGRCISKHFNGLFVVDEETAITVFRKYHSSDDPDRSEKVSPQEVGNNKQHGANNDWQRKTYKSTFTTPKGIFV